jgi:hypothetical protein
MAKVFVGCKLPNGLIMELIRLPENKNSIIPAGRLDEDTVVTLKGANSQRIARTNPADAPYGVTEVDEAFATEWFKRNKGMAFIKNKQVFMAKTREELDSEASNMELLVTTGLEPLKTDGTDPRQQKGIEADKGQLQRFGVTA